MLIFSSSSSLFLSAMLSSEDSLCLLTELACLFSAMDESMLRLASPKDSLSSRYSVILLRMLFMIYILASWLSVGLRRSWMTMFINVLLWASLWLSSLRFRFCLMITSSWSCTICSRTLIRLILSSIICFNFCTLSMLETGVRLRLSYLTNFLDDLSF